jgi:hypothetical protein
VQALANEKGSGIVNWLRGEEVVLLEGHSAMKITEVTVLTLGKHCWRNILHHEFHIGILLGVCG